jgi:hypothetical protein
VHASGRPRSHRRGVCTNWSPAIILEIRLDSIEEEKKGTHQEVAMRSHHFILPSALAAIITLASFVPNAAAQSTYVTGYAPVAGYGYGGYYGGGYNSSTAAEGYLRGWAALVEARGAASLYYAQALGQRELARAQYMENRRVYQQNFADERAAFAERIDLQRQETIRRVERRKRLAAEKAAEREAANEVAIDWPAALTDASYEPIREEIEALAKVRMDLGDKAGESSELAIRHAIRELAKQIVADEEADRMSDAQSQVVRPFVRGLAGEIFRATATQSESVTLTNAMVHSTQR